VTDVFIDARRTSWGPGTGIATASDALLDRLPERAPDLSIRVLRASRISKLERSVPQAPTARAARWAAKLASDLIEVPALAAGARLVHLLYAEAATRGPTVLSLYDTTILEQRRELPSSFAYYVWRTRRLARSAAVVLCPSNATATRVTTVLGPRRDLRVVHLGVDGEGPSAPVEPLDRPVLLYPGGYSPWKNVGTLLEAWDDVRTTWDGELVLTGAGAPRVLPPASRAVGLLPRAALRNMYAAASAVAYPSTSEGFGFPILEGAVRGVPVVCGRVGIVDELPEGLVRISDVESSEGFADGLRDVLLGGWRPDASAVRTAREHFTWDRCADETVAIYRALLGGTSA
jgi:glycosyltransferase involved in cell wall biosynthesis